MTTEIRKILMTYTEAKALLRTHGIRQREVPVEHAISMVMPTKRFGRPSYAYFASPAAREPGQPMRQGAPDRWSAIDAHGGRTILYALTSAAPFAEHTFEAVALPTPTEDVSRLRERIAQTDDLMERVAADWFADGPVDAARKMELLAALGALIPAPLTAQYEALAPDFFAWLKA